MDTVMKPGEFKGVIGAFNGADLFACGTNSCAVPAIV